MINRPLRLVPLLTALAILCAAGPVSAQHPTAVTSIVNSASDTTLEVNYNGSLLMPGTYNPTARNDSIPARGSGTRLMWYPAKAALRAGTVGMLKDGSQWNASKVGANSVAFGVDTKASNFAATAMGRVTTASGVAATAMGRKTTASEFAATAMGLGTTAATTRSLSIGECNDANNTSATGTTLLAVGNGNFAFNTFSCSNTSDALVLDKDAGLLVNGKLGTGSIPTTGAGTRMMWYPAKAAFRTGQVGGAQWDDSNVGDHSTAFGENVQASGDHATALGLGTTASERGAVAMGNGTTAKGFEATALGFETTAATNQSLSIGLYNSANTSSDNTLFVVGNGSSSDRSDALVLDDNGNLTISGGLTENSDRRLKTDIEPISDGVLEALAEIDPVRFRFKDERTHPSGEQIGLIAQEVQKEFPELVSEGASGMLSLAYPKFSAVLLKGLQEQQDQITDLKAENEQIKERLAALEEENTSSLPAGLIGPWALALVLGLGGLGTGLLWRRST